MPVDPSKIRVTPISANDPLASYREAALHWFRFGFMVIPVAPSTKIPALKWEPWLAGLSSATIERHWVEHPTHEVGFIVGENIIVFDCDRPASLASLNSIESQCDMRPNMVVKTTKGSHHFYRRASGTFAKADVHSSELHPERIDVLTGPRLVLLPPSTGKTLALASAKNADDLIEADQGLVDAVFVHNGRVAPRKGLIQPAPSRLPENDKGLVRLKALLDHIEPNIGYDDWLHVLMAIHNETDGSENGLAIADAWSSKGQSYRGIADVTMKWNSFKSGIESGYTIGTLIMMVEDKGFDWIDICAATEPPFEKDDEYKPIADPRRSVHKEIGVGGASDKGSPKERDALRTIQQQYGLINMDGKAWVLDRHSLAERTTQGTASKLVLSNKGDGGLFILRALKAQFPQDDAARVLKDFFVSPETICYAGVDFNPSGASKNYLNLWVGPTLTPKAGEWKLIESFLLEVICDNDQKCYDYLVRYIAHALQRPQEKPGILIVLLGGQGTGKGTLARVLRAIWSATFLQVNNIDTVTGNFNAALERVFIVFMDEALFSGDRKASDALKSLVTEPVIHINEKFQPARQTHSYHRFFAATNADHFKNTERDDRRDFVLRVSEGRKGDRPYWDALHHEIDNGGVEAMVHHLLALNLSGFKVRDKPDTKGLLEQKLQSLGHIARWWYDCLTTGELSPEGKWENFIATDAGIELVFDAAGKSIYKKPSRVEFRRELGRLCPSASPAQPMMGNLRQRGLSLPALAQARIEFEQYIGSPIEWEQE